MVSYLALLLGSPGLFGVLLGTRGVFWLLLAAPGCSLLLLGRSWSDFPGSRKIATMSVMLATVFLFP